MTLVGTATNVKKSALFEASFEGIQLKQAKSLKFLGVHIDQELSMETQTAKVVQRSFSQLVTLRKLRNSLPQRVMKHLIQALVFPHVTYCLPAWAPPVQTLRRRMDKVINFAVRIVSKRRRSDHISDARKELGWLTFEETIYSRDCSLVHKMVHRTNAPHNIKTLACYREDISERPTRASADGMLHIQRCKLEVTRKTVPVRAVRAWNEIAVDLRRNANVHTFKKQLALSLISQQ